MKTFSFPQDVNKVLPLFILGSALMLTACGHMVAGALGITVVNPNNADEVTQHITVSYDKHENMTTIKAPRIFAQNNLTGHTYLLRGWSKGNTLESFSSGQLYIVAQLGDWYFLNSAYSNGKKLKTVEIDRAVGSCVRDCDVSEAIGVNLSKAQIKMIAKSGKDFEVKVSGQRGDVQITVPASYFRAFAKVAKI